MSFHILEQKCLNPRLKGYLGRGLSSMQRVQMVDGSQGRAHRVGHQAEHMEVVAQLTGGHKQSTGGVKFHMRDWFVCVSMEMGN